MPDIQCLCTDFSTEGVEQTASHNSEANLPKPAAKGPVSLHLGELDFQGLVQTVVHR